MKRLISMVWGVLLSAILLSVPGGMAMAQAPQEQYIKKWAPTAVKEMYRSGVPASITLAQGLLESRWGQSALATEGNNHFGIKCHNDWKGKTMKVDDDAKGECFRVYDSAEESFQDHSDFLRYRDRYKFLFDLKPTDYKGWAYGLKKAGYATAPTYAESLIKYIEKYKLYEYDTLTAAEAEALANSYEESVDVKDSGSSVKPSKSSSGKVSSAKSSRAARRAARRSKKHSSLAEEIDYGHLPASPLSIEEPKKITSGRYEEVQFSLHREAYSKNGVPFVTSIDGETYSSIAKSYDLTLREILRFNDLSGERELKPGTIVYLQAKKNRSEKGLDKYIVGSDGESLWGICQRFGVKMSSVCKMNGFDENYQPREGDTIVLRGKK
ncbi:MAG: glucosaminidase domain-containing protein [Bacteroidales bacterium]|jgi:LysM repeat protein|nr:glucosaminidase domain-containing protein [Bacteroidales bacterium]MDY6384792.1 glucosaminidase domain-containing protein [Bacteroidales bacterium]MEE3430788.1 glucosaminidase domain-containing protein [Candidatus Cryptobacteroides sp.]